MITASSVSFLQPTMQGVYPNHKTSTVGLKGKDSDDIKAMEEGPDEKEDPNSLEEDPNGLEDVGGNEYENGDNKYQILESQYRSEPTRCLLYFLWKPKKMTM